MQRIGGRRMRLIGLFAAVLAAISAAGTLAATPARASTDLESHAAALFGDRGALNLRSIALDGHRAVEVRRDGRIEGWIFSTFEVTRSVGYSGQPVDIVVGLRPDLTVAGARLARHSEPILVIGLKDSDLDAFVATFRDLPITGTRAAVLGARRADGLAGATISSGVFRDAVLRSSRAIARSLGLIGATALDRERYERMGWPALVSSGAIQSRRFTAADLAQATRTTTDTPALLVSEVFVALATPAAIGQNLLGKRTYEQLLGTLSADDHLVFVAANGLVSVKGTAWTRTGEFERLAIRQEDRTIRLLASQHRNFEYIAAEGTPDLREMAVFAIPAGSGFEPTRPWTLRVTAVQSTGTGDERTATFDVPYRIPAAYLRSASGQAEAPSAPAAPSDAGQRPPSAATAPVPPPAGEQEPMLQSWFGPGEPELWELNWRARTPEIVMLLIMLGILGFILIFQDWIAERERLYRVARIAFLVATLGFLGLWMKAQLTVVQVLTFVYALRTEFRWELFLIDPVIFILWGFVAVAMLFWGRGVFCGWLCPFGALQELFNEVARRLRVPQVEVPWGLHERLTMIKYLVFLAIFAISLNSMTLAFTAAEVEPFKTVVAMHFAREWPFVLYAATLLGAGLFIRRFFCRYLCPLGAALALPARMRMFEWLKRRPQCGRECHICEVQCPVQAINRLGQISPNECIYCLNCQKLYHDEKTCMGLRARVQRREALAALAPKTEAPNG